MTKLKSFFKRYKIEILSFLIPIFLFGIACVFAKIFPFGESYVATYDGGVQYGGFTAYLSRVLRGSESLFYSFKGGLGYNFYATAIYYLFNPTNILSIFFNESNVMIFYTIIVYLRIGLCGFTMSKYLLSKEKKGIWTIVFSVAYSLISYNTLYFYNFMYFDTVVLLPLVILGLDKLIHKGDVKLYIIFLSLSIISNYYIGYMVCIFSFLYFIYQYIIMDKKKRNKSIIFKFIISSLLCGLISCFVLLPEFFELMNGKASMYMQDYTKYNVFGADAFTSFYRLTIGAYEVGDQSNGGPNVYSTIFVFVLTILFFFNKKFSTKDKIATGIFIGFFLLCFSYNLLDYAWQFFQKPIWYPNRYSFIFSFLLIITAYKSFCNIDHLKIHPYINVCLAFIVILIVVGAGIYSEVFKDTGKLIFLGLSVVCILEYFLTIKNYKILLFILSVLFIEVSANTISNLKEVSFGKQVSTYGELFDNYDKSFNYIESIESDENNFYRAESKSWANLNNASLYNYNGLSYFNSLRNGKVMTFLEDYAGYAVHDNCSTRFNVYNPIYTSLLGFKYIVDSPLSSAYKKLTTDYKYDVYLNEDALPLGFMVNNKINDVKLRVNEDVKNSNKIVMGSLGTNTPIYEERLYDEVVKYWEEYDDGVKYVRYNSKDGGYVLYKGTADKNYYVMLSEVMRTSGSSTILINNTPYPSGASTFNSAIKLNKGDTYVIKFYFSTARHTVDELKMAFIDYDAYVNWINEMKSNSLEIIKYDKDNYIKAKVNVNNDKTTLFTSIPYDKGWNIYVDGKKTKYENLITSFIGVDLTEGEHVIEFNYIPRGLIIGIITSIIGVITSIVYVKKTKHKKA